MLGLFLPAHSQLIVVVVVVDCVDPTCTYVSREVQRLPRRPWHRASEGFVVMT